MRHAYSTIVLLLLAACAGGGGGGSGAPLGLPEVPFTGFSAVQANTTAVMTGGISRTATGTYHGTLPNISLDTVNPVVEDTSAANTQKLTYDGNRTLSGMSFSTPAGGASFTRSAGTTFTCNAGVCGAQNVSGMALVIDGTVPVPNQWNYQTFGVWAELTSATTFQAGAISAGVVTPASAVPTTGTATFTGVANGFFAERLSGTFITPSFMTASMTANVNFSAGTIGFATSGSMQIPLNGAPAFNRPALDMNGTLNYAPAVSSQFTGNVSTSTSGMSGTATGRFYGPAAQEMGGTFSLTGTDGVLVGGFGGRR